MKKKRVTISDVAKASGVSPAVVSRVLNNDHTLNVREQTKKDVLDAVSTMGYTPNLHARGLRTSKSQTIAMIVPVKNSPVFLPLMESAVEAAKSLSYSLLLGGIGVSGNDPQLPGKLLYANNVDGFLVSTGKNEKEQLAALTKLQAPVVLVNRDFDGLFPCVLLDDFGGVRAVVRHLLELGHRRIAFLGSMKRHLGTGRFAGYRAALADYAVELDKNYILDAGYDMAGGERCMDKLMKLPSRPTAVFATNHLVVAGSYRSARRHNLSVPKDVSIAGLYDGPMAPLMSPSITSVCFPIERLGAQAVEMLADIIRGNGVRDRRIVIPHEQLALRESTGEVPARIRKASMSEA